MSLFDSLKEEANKRKLEKQQSDSFIAREKERIHQERLEAREKRNIIRKKIKFVDDIASKSEERKDAEELARVEFEQSQKIKKARSERRNKMVSRNKGKLAISGIVCIALVVGGGFTVNKVQEHNELQKYSAAVDCILDEDYEQAEEILQEISTEDSKQLLEYSEMQEGIESYSGDPDRFQNKLDNFDKISNVEVRAQVDEAIEEVKKAEKVQSNIDEITVSEVTLESKSEISEMSDQVSELNERYVALVDTKDLESAETTIEHLEKNDSVGRTINAINAIGDVTLQSEDLIDKARTSCDELTTSEQKDVVNLSVLRSAESSLSNLKREKEAAEKAEQERIRKEIEEKAAEEAARNATATEEQSKLNLIVWRTKTGDCYHMEWCPYLRSRAGSMTQKQAIDRGLKPCDKCIKGYDLPDYWFNRY